jgi:hypothetical protein
MDYRKIGIPFQVEKRDFSLFHNVQTGVEVLPASCLMCTELLHGVQTVGALN